MGIETVVDNFHLSNGMMNSKKNKNKKKKDSDLPRSNVDFVRASEVLAVIPDVSTSRRLKPAEMSRCSSLSYTTTMVAPLLFSTPSSSITNLPY
jgi:hypothetical protein